MPPSQRDLTNLYVSESYYRLMQTDPTDDKTLLDGTGSLVTELAVSGTIDAFYLKGDGSQLTNVNLSGSNSFTSSQQVIDSLKNKTVEVNTLVAQQYVVSSSVYYVTQSWSSGSTIFGNSADDTHQFTGSVFINGPLTISGGVTGSITTASYIDPLFISASAVQYGFSTPPLYWANIQNIPQNLISGSGQRPVLGLGTSDNVVFGSVSASTANFDGNVIIDGTLTAKTYVISSSVLDVTTLRESGSTIFGNTSDDTHEFTGSVLINGSATSSLGFYGNLTGTSSLASLAQTSSYIDPLFISASVAYYGFAGANDVQWNNILFKPANIISGSGQRDILGLSESDSPTFSTVYATNANLDGNLLVGGTITARTYIISSSVVNYETLNVSGSTKFGDSPDDTHQFTGSLFVSGSTKFGNSISDTHEFSGSVRVDNVIISTNEVNYGPPNLSGSTDRITLWDNSANPAAYNYAIGIEGNHLWSAVDVNNSDWGFKWYAGGVEIAHLNGEGGLNLTDITASQITASGITGSLQGTSSFALTASYALNAAGFNSGSYATTASNTFFGNQTVNGDITISGNLTAQQYIVSSSVLYLTQSFSSGSTVFGNSLDDTHKFTGSLYVTGALVIPTVQTLSPTADVGSIVINNNNLYIYF